MAIPGDREEDGVMASINITPLTDVLLVLLIIFMITAGALQTERIQIPFTHYKNKANETDLVISIQKDKSIYVGAVNVAQSELAPYLEKIAADSDKIIIKGDKDTAYGSVAQVMDAARMAGFNNISLATKPLEEVKR